VKGGGPDPDTEAAGDRAPWSRGAPDAGRAMRRRLLDTQLRAHHLHGGKVVITVETPSQREA